MDLAKEVVPTRDEVGRNRPNFADGGPRRGAEALPVVEQPSRCAAAHGDDVRLCEGQRDAVQVIDRTGASVEGCVLHGAVLLASLEGGRVFPWKGPDGAAIEVFRRAQTMPAFGFLGGRGIARADAAVGEAPIPPTSDAGTQGEDQGRLRWSWSGNARSSCLIETTESEPRGSA
jgi:hypothetical protein